MIDRVLEGEAMRRARGLATGVLGVVLLSWSSHRALSIPLSVTSIGNERVGGAMARDFLDAVYFPVREFNSGGDPYLPDNMFDRWGAVQEFDLYAPFHLLLHAPLGLLPQLAAWRVYVVLLWVAIAATIALAACALGIRDRAVRLLLVGGFLFVEPAKFAIWYGNVNPLIWLGATLMLTAGRQHALLAVLAAPLVWVKPQYGLPATIVMWALGHRGRALGGLLLTALASLPAGAVIVAREGGLGGFLDVVRVNLTYAQGTSYGRLDSVETTRIDGYASLFAAGGRLPGGEFAVTVVVSLLLVGALLLLRRGQADLSVGGRADPLVLALAGSATYLVLVHSMGEVFLLALPLLAAVALLIRGERGWAGWPLWAALVFSFGVVMFIVPAQITMVDWLGVGSPRRVVGFVVAGIFALSLGAAVSNARSGADARRAMR